jgi:hypothetical protein
MLSVDAAANTTDSLMLSWKSLLVKINGVT